MRVGTQTPTLYERSGKEWAAICNPWHSPHSEFNRNLVENRKQENKVTRVVLRGEKLSFDEWNIYERWLQRLGCDDFSMT